jgi:peptidoglycan/xylan/chitin deacetylase (PgdA/CDA1 family)
MYHDFEDVNDPARRKKGAFQEPTKDDFEAQLIIIKNHFRAISVENAMKEIRYGGGLQENSVAITFDDGYASAYDIAYPLLKKYGISATVYIPTDWIDGKLILWWEDLADIVYGFDVDNANINKLQQILRQLKVGLTTKLTNHRDSRDMLFQDLSSALMKTEDRDRTSIIADLTGNLIGGKPYKRNDVKPLTWNQIKEMADSGINFGAHTKSHLNLSFADLDLACEEITKSKQELEKHLGREITGFAYPYGYDVSGYARFTTLLQTCGFDYACTSWWGSNDNNTDPFLLYRGALSPLSSRPLLGRELYVSLLLEPIAETR